MTEAELLFNCFVAGGPAPPEVAQSYDAALIALSIPADPLVTRLVAARADLAAAEFALRRRDPSNALTRRALVMLTLAGDSAALEKPHRARAWLALSTAPFLSIWRYAKGALLLVRHAG